MKQNIFRGLIRVPIKMKFFLFNILLLKLVYIFEHYHLFHITMYKCLFSDGNTVRILIAKFKIGNGNYYSATFMTSLNKIA